MVVLAFQRGVGGSVGVGQLHIRISHAHGGLGSPIIRPRRQRLLLQIGQVGRQRRRNKIAGDIEGAARLLVADQGLQLVAGLHQVHLSVRFVRFELRQLQIEPFVIQLANVSRIVTVEVDLQFVTKAAQIILRQFQSRFGQEQIGEVLPHLQSRLSYLIVILASVWAVCARALSRRQRRFCPRSKSRDSCKL